VGLAFRRSHKGPASSYLAILILALGIGANAAIFSVVNSVLLRPLGYQSPDRLVRLWESNPDKGWDKEVAAPANFYDWQSQTRSFASMAAYAENSLTLTGAGDAEQVRGAFTTPGLFEVLGARPLRGRTFLPAENWEGSPASAVLSYSLWKRRFGGDGAILGKLIKLDDTAYAVVGVMPLDFRSPSGRPEVWVTHRWKRAEVSQAEWARRGHFLTVIGRLKPDVSLEAAQADLSTVAQRLESAYPATNTHMTAGLTPLNEWIAGDTRRPLVLLLGAVAFVLLIACSNVANLLLARAVGRTREIALRIALGADRARLVHQLLAESLALALYGGVLGLLLSAWGVRALIALAPSDIPRLAETSLDGRVFLFTLLLSTLAGLISGVIPALSMSRQNPGAILKEVGRSASAGPRRQRARSLLVIAEVALAVVLVIAAGLLTKSFLLLERVDPGVNPANLLTLQLSLSPAKYPDDARVRAYFDEMSGRLRTLPGVRGVAAASSLLLTGSGWTSDLSIQGRGELGAGVQVSHKEISPEYFSTMGVEVLRGRGLALSDDQRAPRVAVVNDALARRFFPDVNPIGQRIAFGKKADEPASWSTVVGVVRDEKEDGLGAEVQPEVYESLAQTPRSSRYLMIRTTSDPLALAGPVRAQVRAVDPDVPITNLRSMEEVVSASLSRPRFLALMLSLLGMAALALAVVGIFGIVSYTTSQRTAEIGVRMALGAQAGQVVGMVMAQGMGLVLSGLAVGLALALVITRWLRTLLFGVSSMDPLTFGGVSLFLALVGLTACLLPAWRTAKIDPMVSLRSE
jgi:putative ABC transport system permease protein